MNADNTNKKHGIITLSPNEIGEGKEAESNKKTKNQSLQCAGGIVGRIIE